MPWLIPNAVLALLWMWMLDPNLGIVNHWLNAIGIPSQGFLGSESQVIPTIAGINIWRNMGYTALLLFGGLVMIPKSYYEAAVAGRRERVAACSAPITLPLLRPVLALVLVVTVIGSFQVFDTVQIATGGFGGAPGRPGQREPRALPVHLPAGVRVQRPRLRVRARRRADPAAGHRRRIQMRLLRAGESDLA